MYAINEKQEICKIDYESPRILMKRKIEGLSNSEGIVSSHIQQVTPLVFAIGSIEKTEVENEVVLKNLPEKTTFRSYLHVVSGDISEDAQGELQIKAFEIPLLLFQADSNKAIIFRSLFIKER